MPKVIDKYTLEDIVCAHEIKAGVFISVKSPKRLLQDLSRVLASLQQHRNI